MNVHIYSTFSSIIPVCVGRQELELDSPGFRDLLPIGGTDLIAKDLEVNVKAADFEVGHYCGIWIKLMLTLMGLERAHKNDV